MGTRRRNPKRPQLTREQALELIRGAEKAVQLGRLARERDVRTGLLAKAARTTLKREKDRDEADR